MPPYALFCLIGIHVYLVLTFDRFQYKFFYYFLFFLFFLKKKKKKTRELLKAKHLRFKVYNFQFAKLNIHAKRLKIKQYLNREI